MNWPLIDSANLLNPHCLKSVQIRRFFWSIFLDVWTEYRKIRPRKNSVFGHFSRYVWCPLKGHIFSGPTSLIVNSCFKDAQKMINTVNSAKILDIVNLLFHSRVMLRAAANGFAKNVGSLQVDDALEWNENVPMTILICHPDTTSLSSITDAIFCVNLLNIRDRYFYPFPSNSQSVPNCSLVYCISSLISCWHSNVV